MSLRAGLNLDFPLNPSNMVYNVKEVYIVYQQNGFKKRENTDQSISVKKGYQDLNIHEFSSMLKKLETMKMFCIATIEIVSFEVDRFLRWSETPPPPRPPVKNIFSRESN